MRISDAFQAFFRVLGGADLVDKATLPPPPEPTAPEPDPETEKKLVETEAKLAEAVASLTSAEAAQTEAAEVQFRDGAVYGLLLLQREGRLIDFLQENVDDYEDEQIGGAVRQIHRDCGKVLQENFAMAAIVDESENEKTVVAEDFDPSAIKLTGKVPSEPPYKGFLRHKGWRATKVHFPTRSGKIDPTVVQPAEVEFI